MNREEFEKVIDSIKLNDEMKKIIDELKAQEESRQRACNESGYIVFTMEYVKWLENKIKHFQESTKTYLDLLRKEGI